MVWYRGGSDIPNARWIAKYAKESDVTDRIFNSTSLNYDFNENMSLTYRVGYDAYTQRQNREFQKGISATYPNINNGILQTQTISNTIWNHDLIFNITRQVSSDINATGRFGVNARNDFFSA
jgi:hypothetical protein